MASKTKVLIGILVVVVVASVFVFLSRSSQNVIIITHQTEYSSKEAPQMSIKNNLDKNICFSDCYPYYLEKKEEKWQSYLYGECPEPNLVARCIESGQAKGFELITSGLEAGLHRIAIPACLGCQIGEYFKEDKRFYSNEFQIK